MAKTKFTIEQNGATFHGTDGDDKILIRNCSGVRIYGEDGNDKIDDNEPSHAGNNHYFGGEGRDYLYGAAPNSWLHGGAGRDTLFTTGHTGDGGAHFLFDAADETSKDNVYAMASDKFVFNAADYGLTEGNGLIDGQLDPDWFESGLGQVDQVGHGTFFFNEKNNTLCWDADGKGGADRIPIAQMIQPGEVTFNFEQILINHNADLYI